jgi:hypothetical protein
MANTGGSSPVPVQIITSANGQQVIEHVQSISPSLIQQQHNQHHVTQQEVQISQQQGQIVYTTVPQDSPVTQTVLVHQQQQHQAPPPQQQQQQQQQQVIVHHHQPHQPKPKTHFCQHCQKGFANKHGLQLHNKRHPSGECTIRSHICNECNRAFFQKNHLLLHQRQHMEQQRVAQAVVVNQVVVEKEVPAEDERTNGQEQQQQDVEMIGDVEDIESQQVSEMQWFLKLKSECTSLKIEGHCDWRGRRCGAKEPKRRRRSECDNGRASVGRAANAKCHRERQQQRGR